MNRTHLALLLLLLTGLAAPLGGCAQETLPLSQGATREGPTRGGAAAEGPDATQAGDAPDASVPGSRPPGACQQARAEPLPVRLRVMSGDAGGAPPGRTVLIDDLVTQFKSNCSPCHTNGSQAPTIATSADFQTKMNDSAIGQVMLDANGALPAMPPLNSYTGKPWSQRLPSDPIVELVKETKAWLSAGKPSSFSYLGDSADAGSAADDAGASAGEYSLSPATGNAMTNLGSCVPSASLVASSTASEEARARALDAMFEAAQKTNAGASVTVDQQLGLPLTLDKTDLFTLDTRILARYGVIAYAPGYPLWSDNAGKIRYVRVPRGTSIKFDKTTQKFDIPPNTRFYKTFLKPVIELADGSIRWKKMETRLIVARPNPADGKTDPDLATYVPPALFGTYQWDDGETKATLVQDRLHDGSFFTDNVVEYTVDEPLAADLLQTQPQDPLGYLVRTKAARHYAIPSSVRCVECHRGSPSADFVLGFTPLQIQRRRTGQGGTIEPTGEHELTQLQRLIDYGVVTGIDSIETDVLPLEKSQGSRAPRNEHELVAQGYMLGNCAHCHNPHGEPTVENPVLRDYLNFLPSADGGGIFQFPLERRSPRITRGNTEIKSIPYITPSLLDQPDRDPISTINTRVLSTDPFVQFTSPLTGDNHVNIAIYGPWRSLIYRNVDNAFAYTDDVALYPHMPRNTPGYDPRAKQILGDWMVSIPAVLKHPDLGEYVAIKSPVSTFPIWADDEEQPYVEVQPGSPQYAQAAQAAGQRLQIFHTGLNPALPLLPGNPSYSRYGDSADAFDILDQNVLRDPICYPTPPPARDPLDPYPFSLRPHWVTTDLTDYPGDWTPRRADWEDKLVRQNPDQPPPFCTGQGGVDVLAGEQAVVRLFNAVSPSAPTPTLDLGKDSLTGGDSARRFATTKRPFGLWKRKPGCTFPGEKRVGDLVPCTAGMPCDHSWLVAAKDGPNQIPMGLSAGSSAVRGLSDTEMDPNAPVYMEAPGASVFKMICINCHGPLADSSGRMAQNLATMTGGISRVANFRHGLQGPDDQHANFKRVFAPNAGWPAPWASLSAEDVAARYMGWMALGGTRATIPTDIITLVGTTTVVGLRRAKAISGGSANMLSNAKSFCSNLVTFPDESDRINYGAFDARPGHGYLDAFNRAFIRKNGDAELWLRLCTLNNHPPVRAIEGGKITSPYDGGAGYIRPDYLIPWDHYGTGPVGNERGGVDDHLLDSNEWPWCFKSGATPPLCPPEALSMTAPHPSEADNDDFATRGAINAAFAVFTYLETLEQKTAADPEYDHCELLDAPSSTNPTPGR